VEETTMATDSRDLIDHLQIVALCTRYAVAVDARDFADVADCFTSDGMLETVIPPNVMRGRDKIEAGLRARTSSTLAAQHLVSNHQYQVDGDEGAGTSSFVMHRWPKPPTIASGAIAHGGTYFDTLKRTERGWRLKQRRIEILWGPGVLAAPDRTE
jgi:ketosteroid isomerase-like protein